MDDDKTASDKEDLIFLLASTIKTGDPDVSLDTAVAAGAILVKTMEANGWEIKRRSPKPH